MVELFDQVLNVEAYRHQPHLCLSQPLDAMVSGIGPVEVSIHFTDRTGDAIIQ